MSINIIDKLKHASGGAVADAEDIEMPDGSSVAERIADMAQAMAERLPAAVTAAQYEALADAGLVYDTQQYLIVKVDTYTPTGLDAAQLEALGTAGLLPGSDTA